MGFKWDYGSKLERELEGPLKNFYPDASRIVIDTDSGLVHVYETTRRDPITITIEGALRFAENRRAQMWDYNGE